MEEESTSFMGWSIKEYETYKNVLNNINLQKENYNNILNDILQNKINLLKITGNL